MIGFEGDGCGSERSRERSERKVFVFLEREKNTSLICRVE
jgi:hypothetical protein